MMLVVELLYCLMGCSMMQVNHYEFDLHHQLLIYRFFHVICSLQPFGILF